MKAKKISKRLVSIMLVLVLAFGSMLAVYAATPKATVKAKGTLEFTLKGLKHNLAVQNYYIGTTYLYTTQRSGSTTYMSRLLMDTSAKTATYVDEMTLLNCGHGQSLDYYSYNNNGYFYVGCKAEESDMHFSVQISRLTYEAGATYDYTDLNRFTYMNYATKSTKSLGTTYRVAAGGNSNYTIFRIQTKEGTVTYSIYDTAAINKLLDSSKTVSMNTAAARNACKYTFTQSGSNIVRPNGSFQGIDMVGCSKLFISGGGDGETPMMARLTNTGTFAALVKITNVGLCEIEGVQCKNDKVYFLIKPDATAKKNTQQIYSVPETTFYP